jgi:hypothetical protein
MLANSDVATQQYKSARRRPYFYPASDKKTHLVDDAAGIFPTCTPMLDERRQEIESLSSGSYASVASTTAEVFMTWDRYVADAGGAMIARTKFRRTS